MNKQMRTSVALPLIGLNAAWVITMFANYASHVENNNSMVIVGDSWRGPGEIRTSTFLFLAAIAVFAIVASIAHRIADQQQVLAGEGNRAAHAAFRFASLAVIIGLAAGAIYAISTFLGSFQTFTATPVTLVGRLVGTYLPIVLATALVIYVLLQVTVFRKSAPSGKDESGKMTKEQRAMVLGFSLPIAATALAIILGLAFWDIQGQRLDNWVWVVIQAIVAAGLVFGTRAAVSARAAKPVAVKPRVSGAGAAGAVTLNFVLSIVFGGVVTIMAFAMGGDAFGMLGTETYKGLDANWIFNLLLPAYAMIVLVTFGVYTTIVARHGEGKKAA